MKKIPGFLIPILVIITAILSGGPLSSRKKEEDKKLITADTLKTMATDFKLKIISH